jgi:hypothetical protein
VAAEIAPLAEGVVNQADAVQGTGNSGAWSSATGMAKAADIAWRPALQACLILSIPAGLLVSMLSPIMAVLWIMGAGAWAVVLYTRRARVRGVSTGAGARIGLIVGLFTGWLTCGVNGIALWVTRALQHQGSEIDSLWQTTVQKNFEQQQQLLAQMGLATADSAQMAQMAGSMRALMMSAEGRAGFVLLDFLMIGAAVVLFSMIGGAMGARFLTQSRRTGA